MDTNYTVDGNLIRLCSSSQAFAPQFVRISGNGWQVMGDSDGQLWGHSLPLIERACSAVRFTVADARHLYEAGRVTPICFMLDDEIPMAALSYTWDSEELGRVLVCIVAPDGPWIMGALGAVIGTLFDIGRNQKYDCIILRSPDELPTLRGWEEISVPDGEALLRRVDDPPRPEYDALMGLYRGDVA